MAVKLMPVAPVADAQSPAEVETKPQRVPRKRRRSMVYDADGNEVLITLKCVHCGRMHPLSNFGLRKMADGAIRNQPWCRECRGSSTAKKKQPETQAPVEPVSPPEPVAAPIASGPMLVVPLTADQALAQFRALAPQTPVAEPVETTPEPASEGTQPE